MGIYLAPELIRKGHEVHITTRAVHFSSSEHLRYITGDARDVGFVMRLMRNQHYDAVVDFMIYNTDEFKDRCAQLLESTEHYLFISSYRVFADSGQNPITEQSPHLINVCKDRDYLATDEYALSKARQENILRQSKKGNWTILRPSITYSRNRLQLGTLEANVIFYRSFQGIPVIMAKNILSKTTTMTWAGDVAKMITALLLNQHAFGDDFNVVTSESQTWRTVADIYRQSIGLKIIETSLKIYENVVGGKYQIKYDRTINRSLDNRKVLQATGLSQSDFLTLNTGLNIEIVNFRNNPHFTNLDIALHARMDLATRNSISMAGLTPAQVWEYRNHKNPLAYRVACLKNKFLRRMGQ